MAVVTKTIGSGGGRDYSSLTTWMAGLPANLVTAGNSYVASMFNDSEIVDTTGSSAPNLNLTGFTTDATHTITITAAAGQAWCDNVSNVGGYLATNGVAIRRTDHRSTVIECDVNFVTISRLQLSGGHIAINVVGESVTITNCILEVFLSTGVVNINGGNTTLANNFIITNNASNGSPAIGIGHNGSNGPTTIVYNTIVRNSDYSPGDAIIGNHYGWSGTFTNNACFGFTSTYDAAGTTGTNNGTDQSSVTGSTSNQVSLAYANQFNTTTNSGEDFRLKTASGLIRNGVTYGGISLDAYGTSRSTTPAIGAFQPPAVTVSTTLTTTGTNTWPVPLDCPLGSVLTVECWGAGSGGTGRVASTFGAAGAGGAYSKSLYFVSPGDTTNGITYTIGAGTAGLSGANPAAGGDTSFSSNNLNIITDTTNIGFTVGGAVTGATGWFLQNGTGLTTTISGFGIDPTIGLPYVDIHVAGTSTGGTLNWLLALDTLSPAIASTTYTLSYYTSIVGGSTANITAFALLWQNNNGATFLSNSATTAFTPNATLTQISKTAASPASTTGVYPYYRFTYGTSAVINITLRIAGCQMEVAGAPSFYKATPSYTLAKGGGAPSGTTGGTGGSSAASIGTIEVDAGGNGAAFNAAGSGGGAAGGKDGAGTAGSVAGVGGNGDASSGGTGGAVKATSPGNAGGSNPLGGGGGGGLKTVAGTGGAGGAPGGGGGGGAVATSTGGNAADGQIILTYTSVQTFESVNGASITASAGSITPTVAKTVTGAACTSAAGTATATPTLVTTVTGAACTASAGSPHITVAIVPTGASITTSAGSVTVSASGLTTVNATGSSATASTGSPSVIVAFVPTGTSVTASAGTVNKTGSLTMTGAACTSAAGSSVPSISIVPTGASCTSAAGTVNKSISIVPTGASCTSAAGSSVPSISIVPTGTSCTISAGSSVPSISIFPLGTSCTSAGGSPIPSIAIIPTGASCSTLAGSSVPSISIVSVGAACSTSAGTVNKSISIVPIGATCTSAAGSSTGTISETITGTSATASAGIIAPNIAITASGIGAQAFAGVSAIGLAITPTGASATSSAGSQSLSENMIPSGSAITANAGAISPEVMLVASASSSMTSGTGSVTSAQLVPTGSAISAATGSPAIGIALVSSGASITTSAGSVNVSTSTSNSFSTSGASVATSAGQVSFSSSENFTTNGASVSCAAGSPTILQVQQVHGSSITVATSSIIPAISQIFTGSSVSALGGMNLLNLVILVVAGSSITIATSPPSVATDSSSQIIPTGASAVCTVGAEIKTLSFEMTGAQSGTACGTVYPQPSIGPSGATGSTHAGEMAFAIGFGLSGASIEAQSGNALAQPIYSFGVTGSSVTIAVGPVTVSVINNQGQMINVLVNFGFRSRCSITTNFVRSSVRTIVVEGETGHEFNKVSNIRKIVI